MRCVKPLSVNLHHVAGFEPDVLGEILSFDVFFVVEPHDQISAENADIFLIRKFGESSGIRIADRIFWDWWFIRDRVLHDLNVSDAQWTPWDADLVSLPG